MHRAVKVRIYPTAEQEAFLTRQFGAVRFVYNKGLSLMRHSYQFHGLSLNANKHIKPLLVPAKQSRKYAWLDEFDSISLQETCRNLNKAFSHFFKKRARYPRFKRRHGYQSRYHCTSVQCGDNWIKVPKLKTTIKAKIHRTMEGDLKSIHLSKTATGKYYASLLFETKVAAPKPSTTITEDNVMGIDVGITHLLNGSDGKKTPNPKHLYRARVNLRRKQKSFSRKVKGSNRRAKARQSLAKCHERIAHAREDFQHKVTNQLVDENQAIVVETLKVKNMLKNHRLAKSISDCAWGKLLEKLAYKAESQGKHFVKIDQWFASSKTCSICGHKMDKLSLSVRQWTCPTCGRQHDRDMNAALNIKQQGILKLKAEGKSVSASGGLRKTD